MSARANRIVVIGFVIGIVAIVALGFARNWTPAIPADAALTPIAETELVGQVDPDPHGDGEMPDTPLSPSGQKCLDRITNENGHLELCWSISRERDLDAEKDYYQLRLYGSVVGSGSGIRWWALSADLLGEPGDQVFDGWPSGTIDGPCTQQRVSGLGPTGQETAEICGRTTGNYVQTATWAYRVTWSCVGCLLPDHSDREVVLYSFVGVPQGTVPTWSIGADFGG